MKEIIKEIGYGIRSELQGLCGKIAPQNRRKAVVILLVLFTAGNLYFTLSSFCNTGKGKQSNEQLQIEHIRQFPLENSDSPYGKAPDNDSIGINLQNK
jgi:hypothetical protein